MSSSTIASLIKTYQQVIIYSGLPILVLGLVGGLQNVFIFLSLRTFRQSSCAFYLTVMSFVNIIQLLTGLLSRIMISGFHIDWTQSSTFYCKFRTFFFQISSVTSLTCFCLATIDQYLATCSQPRWRQYSHIRTARFLLMCALILILIEQSPCLFWYDRRTIAASNETICTITDKTFEKFNAYFNYLVLGNIIPHLTNLTFGLLAYRNIQQLSYRTVPLVRRELDKQLTSIVLVQLIFNFCTLLPNFFIYVIGAYGNIQDPVVRAQINLAYAITLCLYYSYYAVSSV